MNLTTRQLDQFEAYSAILRGWSVRLNLTRVFTREGIVRLHFLDSLTCLTVIPHSAGLRTIDVGSGAGFPGVPMKIAIPGLEMTLLDASRRRVAFLEMLVDELGVDAEVIHGRAEDLSREAEYGGCYDLVVSRATAPLDRLVSLCLPFLRDGGLAVLPKGPRVEAELASAEEAIHSSGGVIEAVRPVTIPGLTRRRNLVAIRRIGPGPTILPAG